MRMRRYCRLGSFPSMGNTSSDESFKGYILIYVDGFQVHDWRCIEHNYPEDVFPFPEAAGWAVGDNPRDRYCSRLSTDKLRRFTDYDEAVRYVFEKRRKRKNERFQLMYVLDNNFHAVSTLDDILAIDKAHDEDQQAIAAQRAQLQAEFDKDLPGLNALQKVTGRHTAYAASELLKKMQDDGIEAAKASIPTSSYYRLVKVLRAAGLMPA